MAALNHTPVSKSSNGTPLYECVCPDCGKIRLGDKRKIGKPCMSCSNKRRSTHGLSGNPLYRLLKNMVARCTYPSASGYEYYGGRGIRVCDEWMSDPKKFADWAVENGYGPNKEIDRIDTNGPYAPWNCQFIEHQRNSQKRSNQVCDVGTAKEIKRRLIAGESVKSISKGLDIHYMVVWHISKGNTWRNA